MNKIIRYKLFPSSDAFADWQRETGSTVLGVTPMLSGMDLSNMEQGSTATSKICVFVTYYGEAP